MYNIRLATNSDRQNIINLQLQMAEESEGLSLDRPVLARGVAAVLNGTAQSQYWIVEREGRTEGMCMTLPEWSDWRNGIILWIHSVYVVRDARRQGVFRALYEHLQEMVSNSTELKGLRLYVDKDNEPAQRVYEALGMSNHHYHLYEWLK